MAKNRHLPRTKRNERVKEILANPEKCALRVPGSQKQYAIPLSQWDRYLSSGIIIAEYPRVGKLAQGWKIVGQSQAGEISVKRDTSQPLRYRLTDTYSSAEVVFNSPLRFAQLVRRGWAEQIGQTRARLIPLFRLDSSELAENGEPRLRAVQGEQLWPNGTTCPTHRICETAWLMSGASFTLAQVEAALQDRQTLIEQETLRWGLPDGKPVRVKESWGVFGEIDYTGKVA